MKTNLSGEKLKQKLIEIGNDVASIWGGSCYDVEILKDRVYFECIEHGKKFIAELTFEEIKKDYNLLI